MAFPPETSTARKDPPATAVRFDDQRPVDQGVELGLADVEADRCLQVARGLDGMSAQTLDHSRRRLARRPVRCVV
eukprot:538442-Heterocapsa_arctica.AAC.1